MREINQINCLHHSRSIELGRGGGGKDYLWKQKQSKIFLQTITQFDGFHWGKIQPSRSINKRLSHGK